MDRNKKIRVASYKQPLLYDVTFNRNEIILFFSRDLEPIIDTDKFIEKIYYKFSLDNPLIDSPKISCIILKDHVTRTLYSDDNKLYVDYITSNGEDYVLKRISKGETYFNDLEQWYFINDKLEVLVYKTEDFSYRLNKGYKMELILTKINNLTMEESINTYADADILSTHVKPPVKTMLKLLKKKTI